MVKVLKTLHDLCDYSEKIPSVFSVTELNNIKFMKGEDDYRFSTECCVEYEVKPRLSHLEIKDGFLKLYIGRVCYKHILEDRQKYYENNSDDILRRFKKGFDEDNPFKYLASSIGVTALIETIDSKFILGRRNDTIIHPNGRLLHGISGYCESHGDSIFKLNPFRDIERELEEEVGITSNHIAEMHLLGLCFHELKIGSNFIFWVKLWVDSSYFNEGGSWQQAVDAKEHKMFEVFERDELKEIVSKDYLHYSSRGAISRWFHLNNSRKEVSRL